MANTDEKNQNKNIIETAEKNKRKEDTVKDKNLTDKKSRKNNVDEKLADNRTADRQSTKKSADFQVEDEVVVIKEKVTQKGKVKIGSIIGSVLEGIWTGIKLVALVIIVTAVVGFFMSRHLMIRGRSGERVSTEGMNVSATAILNKSRSKESARTWSQSARLVKLTLEADDGSILIARKVVTNALSDKWVVILHGHNGSMEDIYDIAMCYIEEGYNVLMPDLRANGESEGSFYGMGWLDRLDVINWIDVILKDYPAADVVIHGVDVGADTALMLSGEPLKSSIKAIIAEGASTSAWDAVKVEYKTRHAKWPVFPIMHMMNPVMKVWAGYTLTEADAVEQVQKTSVPILLIRGQNDTYISEKMTAELDEAIASEHEVLTVATGTHDDNRFAEPDTYYDKVFEFVDKYIK